mgnify:CR=1 FL=1
MEKTTIKTGIGKLLKAYLTFNNVVWYNLLNCSTFIEERGAKMERQIRARIPEDLADQIDTYLERINGGVETPSDKVSLSDIIRTAVREYLEDHNLDKKGQIVKVRINKSNFIHDDMEEVEGLLEELAKKHPTNRSMSYIIATLRLMILKACCVD